MNGGLEDSLRELVHFADDDDAQHPGIDAVFLSTRGRPKHVADAATTLFDVADNAIVYCLPTSVDDVPLPLRHRFTFPLKEDWHTFKTATSELRTPQTVIGKWYGDGWDLPQKRQFAIWTSWRCGFRRILLVDDDIRGLDRRTILRMQAGLSKYSLVGAYSDDFLDTSVTGHASLAAGIPTSAFLSGNCLAIEITDSHPFFPPIYNEDWLAVLPYLLKGKAASCGSVRHLPYDPFKTPALATFQEAGDFFVDTLFEVISARPKNTAVSCATDSSESVLISSCGATCRTDAFWGEKLRRRTAFLRSLSEAHVDRTDITASMDAAITVSESFNPSIFREFFEAWILDVQTWRSLSAQARSNC